MRVIGYFLVPGPTVSGVISGCWVSGGWAVGGWRFGDPCNARGGLGLYPARATVSLCALESAATAKGRNHVAVVTWEQVRTCALGGFNVMLGRSCWGCEFVVDRIHNALLFPLLQGEGLGGDFSASAARITSCRNR